MEKYNQNTSYNMIENLQSTFATRMRGIGQREIVSQHDLLISINIFLNSLNRLKNKEVIQTNNRLLKFITFFKLSEKSNILRIINRHNFI
mgnify:CR=1 FL=1